jgi:hypothetical protein
MIEAESTQSRCMRDEYLQRKAGPRLIKDSLPAFSFTCKYLYQKKAGK